MFGRKTKYHLSPDGVSECKAKSAKSCYYGGTHYDSLEEAVNAYEQMTKRGNTGGNAVGRDFLKNSENVEVPPIPDRLAQLRSLPSLNTAETEEKARLEHIYTLQQDLSPAKVHAFESETAYCDALIASRADLGNFIKSVSIDNDNEVTFLNSAPYGCLYDDVNNGEKVFYRGFDNCDVITVERANSSSFIYSMKPDHKQIYRVDIQNDGNRVTEVQLVRWEMDDNQTFYDAYTGKSSGVEVLVRPDSKGGGRIYRYASGIDSLEYRDQYSVLLSDRDAIGRIHGYATIGGVRGQEEFNAFHGMEYTRNKAGEIVPSKTVYLTTKSGANVKQERYAPGSILVAEEVKHERTGEYYYPVIGRDGDGPAVSFSVSEDGKKYAKVFYRDNAPTRMVVVDNGEAKEIPLSQGAGVHRNGNTFSVWDEGREIFSGSFEAPLKRAENAMMAELDRRNGLTGEEFENSKNDPIFENVLDFPNPDEYFKARLETN